jgi:hypothetical protein
MLHVSEKKGLKEVEEESFEESKQNPMRATFLFVLINSRRALKSRSSRSCPKSVKSQQD